MKLAALLLAAGVSAANAQTRVIDGDTLEIDHRRVRLWMIDAPELDQTCLDGRGIPWSCGVAAKTRLAYLVGTQIPTCETKDKDRYGRTVARCFAGDLDLGERLVSEGLADLWPPFQRQHPYRGAFVDAALHRRGIHQGQYLHPFYWRNKP